MGILRWVFAGRRTRRKKEGLKDRLRARRSQFIGLFLLLVTVSAVGTVLAHRYELSTGERAGELIKLSRQGIFFKTWEGQLKLSEAASQTWSFTIPDPALAQELQRRMGERITLRYGKRLVSLWWVGDTSYLVEGVR